MGLLIALSVATSPEVGAQPYAIPGAVIAAGGTVASGGDFSLAGTVGQPVVGTMAGAGGSVQGGFWHQPTEIVNDVPEGEELPIEFSLEQNYPNPFNPATTVQFAVPVPTEVSLKVYDTVGREVATLAEGILLPAVYRLSFNGTRFASGMYFYRMQTDGFVKTRKLILLK
jgi:hypothetical protein